MAKKQEGLEQLFVEEIQDLLDAEKQLVKALPKMSRAAQDEELSEALKEHLQVTKGHVERLQRELMGLPRKNGVRLSWRSSSSCGTSSARRASRSRGSWPAPQSLPFRKPSAG